MNWIDGWTWCENHFFDAWFGIDTRGHYSGMQGRCQDANPYEDIPYYLLFQIFSRIKNKDRHHFVDIGCGKGRAVSAASRLAFKKVSGIEIDPVLAEIARRNAACVKGRKANTQIVQADVADYLPDDGTIFFLFNPFGKETFGAMLSCLYKSWENNPRNIQIVYFNPLEADLLESLNWLTREDGQTVRARSSQEARLPYIFFYRSKTL